MLADCTIGLEPLHHVGDHVAVVTDQWGCPTSAADLAAVLTQILMAGVADDFTYVSTAGGAFLDWLAGRQLPAVAALASRRVAPPPSKTMAA